MSLAPGQYLLVFASGKDRSNPAAPLHTSFSLSGDDGYLGLLAPDGSVASGVSFPVCVPRLGRRPLPLLCLCPRHWRVGLPTMETLCCPDPCTLCMQRRLPTDVSFGTVGGQVAAAAESGPRYAVLATPTPGKPNSGPRPGGPLITE